MTKRTTIVLDDSVYETLVKESLRRYGTARSISRVVNDVVRKKVREKTDIMALIYSKKLARTTASEFEADRRELSSRLEN
jgi:predicted CopG family antitoxin